MTTIIGAGGGGKGGGGSARVAVEAKDSLRSKAFAKVLDLVGEGEIEGLVNGLQSVYLDGTPIQNPDGTTNFSGVELVARNGSQAQDRIPNQPGVESTLQVGTEVTAAVSVTRTISNVNVDAARVTIGIPQLTSQNTTNGDINGTTVEYAIDLQSNGGGFVPQLLSQAFTTAGVSQITADRYAATSADTYGMALGLDTFGVLAGYGTSYVVEYKLVSDTLWKSDGVTVSSGKTGGKLMGIVIGSLNGGTVAQTPILPAGVWEIQLRRITATPEMVSVQSAQRYTGRAYETLTGKTTSRYQRSHRIELTGQAPWDIRVRRLTADSTSVALQNKTFFDAYTEIIDAKLRYPNSALVGMKIDSSQFQSIPTRGYDVKLLKIKLPSNYNPTTRVYTGTWDGTFQVAWSDNPAWCFYDLVTTERYGLGGFIDESQVDKWAMYQIGRYCDELVDDGFGGTEPRFTCNFYLQTRAEAYKVLQDFASIFRGMAFWSTGAITAVQDAPSDAVALFTAANVIEGRFNYSGSALRARHTVALVTWNDPGALYAQKVEYVEDAEAIARYGVNQTEVVAVGCTSRGQANRVGRWLLFSERFETETIQFQVGLDGAVVRPGQVIKVADATRAGGRFGGRISASTTAAVTLDNVPAAAAAGWELHAMLPSGDMQTRTVSSINGSVVSVAPAFTEAPTTQGIWVLSSATVEAQTFRVIAVSEDAESKNYNITALKHNPDKYAAIEDGLVLQQRDITLLNDIPAAPTGLAVSESLYTYQAEVRSKISIGWQEVEGIYKYFVDWRKDSGNWTRIETPNTDIELLDTTPGTYNIKVYSANPGNLASADYAEATILALGKTAPPSNVTGFTSVIDPSLGVTLTWNSVPDLDLDVYEVRAGISWDAGTLVGDVKASTLKISQLSSGSTTYWVKALDTSGIYSATAASTVVSITAPAAPSVSAAFVGQDVVLTWGAVQGSLVTAQYEIRYGASFAAGTSMGTIKGTTFAAKAQWSGTRTFWVAAVDLAGNTGAAGQATATITAPVAVSMTQEVVDNNVLLRWADATATLPIDFYELRRGPTWATATPIGRVSARFSAIFESAGGTLTYWVAGYDLAGNEGTPSSIAALVSQPPDYQLQFNQDSTFTGTKTNFVSNGAEFLTPVSGTETWQSHFTSRSWTTLQDQVTAGYPIYAMPSQSAGSYVEEIDYGTVLAATKISATLSYVVTSGTPVVTPTISVRKLATDPWTDYPGVAAAFVTDFRYAKVKYDFASVGGDDLVSISALNIRFDVKLRNDAGVAAVSSSTVGGTVVNFNVAFVDVQSITVTPKGTAAAIAVYDFVDVPYPTSFKILLFDTAGTRIAGDVSWSVKGI